MVGPSKQASKQASKHTHMRAQCSHASVGLAQARPNNVLSVLQANDTCECVSLVEGNAYIKK